MEDTWHVSSHGTAVADMIPVIAGGDLIAEILPIWSDADGVRVTTLWAAECMSAGQAHTLADLLRQVAEMPGPD